MFYGIFWILGFDEVFFAVVFSNNLLCKVLLITITNFLCEFGSYIITLRYGDCQPVGYMWKGLSLIN